MTTDLHRFLDLEYGGDDALRALLDGGADVHARRGPLAETPLHVAARRRRCEAVALLLAHGADADARNGGGKTAYVHALRRGFDDVVAVLGARGVVPLTDADRLAVALVAGRLDDARAILAAAPGAARTGNREEDRLLADVAGRPGTDRVQLLVDAGADLAAPGMDDGTPLHQAVWFGQPDNARLLVAAGAPLDVVDDTHHATPLGWAVHGSRWARDADDSEEPWIASVQLLIAAGARIRDEAELLRLHRDASPAVAALLPRSL